MTPEGPKVAKFTINGQEIEVNPEDLKIQPSPGKYTLPDGTEIVVEAPKEED